ncbi:MAG: PEP-CTERM sorting domain-containing protein [Verrucomicrobiales bacterium]
MNTIKLTRFGTLSLLISLDSQAADGSIIITVIDNGSGGTQMTILSSGSPSTLTGDTGNQLRIGTAGYTFKDSGNGFQDQTSGLFQWGGVSNAHISLFDSGGSGLGSAIAINFDSNVPLGSSFSDLDGVYDLDDIDFAGWNPGSYNLVSATGASVFIEGDTGGPGLGSITLNVVPEPSTSGLLGLLSTFFLLRRKGRRN